MFFKFIECLRLGELVIPAHFATPFVQKIRDMKSSTGKSRTILFFDHTSQLSGGEIALLHLLKHLDREIFVPLVVLGSAGALQRELSAANIETIVMALPQSVVQTRKNSLGAQSLLRFSDGLRIARYALQLSLLARRRGVCLMHTNSLKADLIGGLAARLAGVPVVWHIRDRIADDYLPPKVVRVFRWLCSRVPDGVIANSQATMDTIFPPTRNTKTNKSAAKKPLRRVIYSGVTSRWRSDDNEESRLQMLERREETSDADIVRRSDDNADFMLLRQQDAHRVLDVNAPRIGLIGRISRWKGQHVFVRAMADVHRKYPDARFLIVGAALFGEEEYEKTVRDLASASGLDKVIEWTGFRDDVEQIIETLDIVVHASTISEPFGQVIVQGMAAGKPVVATRGGGVREIVEHGVNGLLVEKNDSQAMSDAISQLLSDPEKARCLGLEAQRSIMRKFTIERTARAAEAMFREVLKAHRRSRRQSEIESAANASARKTSAQIARGQHAREQREKS